MQIVRLAEEPAGARSEQGSENRVWATKIITIGSVASGDGLPECEDDSGESLPSIDRGSPATTDGPPPQASMG